MPIPDLYRIMESGGCIASETTLEAAQKRVVALRAAGLVDLEIHHYVSEAKILALAAAHLACDGTPEQRRRDYHVACVLEMLLEPSR